MTVYLVFQVDRESFSTDACYEDGWYDDYYEDVVESVSLIGVYATEELAKKAVDKYEDDCHYDSSVYYMAYEVLEEVEDEKDEQSINYKTN